MKLAYSAGLALAASICVGTAGAARADAYAFAETKDYNFGVVDLTTGAYTLCGNSGLLLAGLAADTAGHVYGGAYLGTGFYSVNPANGALTLVGNATIDFYGMGSTTKGVYALDTSANLYSVNTQTGAVTLVGSTGLSPGGTYGLSDGGSKLYFTQNDALYTLSTKTGAAKLIGIGTQAFGALLMSKKVLYGGTATTSAPTLWTINTTTAAETMLSTLQTETGNFWGLAPTPKKESGACPA
jgi:hypothetical protein